MQSGVGLRKSGDPDDQRLKQDIIRHVDKYMQKSKIEEARMKTHEENNVNRVLTVHQTYHRTRHQIAT
jgi:hypothetical protein